MRTAATRTLRTSLLLFLCVPPAAAGETAAEAEREESAREPSWTAREIMQRVEERDDGDGLVADMTMVLIDGSGRQRVRSMRSYEKDFGAGTRRLLFFLAPADVEETGFLTYDYRDGDKDDDQWLYLPALQRVKRIAGGSRTDRFMGSDFTYADMTRRETDRYEYRVMGEGEVDGFRVWQIEAVPRSRAEIEETGYEKSVLFVRQDNFVVVRAVHWVEDASRLKYFEVRELEQIDGIWVPREMHMSTREGRTILHKTVLAIGRIRFTSDLPESLFTVRQLRKGLRSMSAP